MYKLSWFKIFAIIFCMWQKYISTNAQKSYLQKKYSASVIEDAQLDVVQLLQKYNYPVERHYITTEDNYILGMHRIPRPGAQPIFLMHGLTDTSASWIMMGPWSGLGYYLYDQGYDIWMGNARGNFYSRNHTTFNPSIDKSFWKFTWHEIGIYDLPAMIDYVLENTKKSKLGYVGHSQGTTAFFVMCSMRPEYNAKFTIMHAMAPVAFMKNIKTPLLSVTHNFFKMSGEMFTEFLPLSDIPLKTCFTTAIAESTCLDSLNQLMGKDVKMMNMSMFPVMMGHLPAGCNFKQIIHFVQLVDSDRFCQFDHGPLENMRRYGKVQPPAYALDKIIVPVTLNYAYNDFLTSEVDVHRLAKLLPNVVDDNLYPYRKWNHVTMVWGPDARELAHKRLLEWFRKYD